MYFLLPHSFLSIDTLCTVYYIFITTVVTVFAIFPSLHDFLLHGKQLATTKKKKKKQKSLPAPVVSEPSPRSWISLLVPSSSFSHVNASSASSKVLKQKQLNHKPSSHSRSPFFPFPSSPFYSTPGPWYHRLLSSLYHQMKCLYVPKHWFSHFYLLATPWSLYLSWLSTRAVLVFFTFHVARRCLEQLFLFPKRSHSRMHLGHYVLGLSFYCMTPLAYVSSPSWTSTLVTLFFFLINFCQTYHHALLAFSHPTVGSNGWVDRLPSQGLFRYLFCPHYFCEIILYLLFLFMAPTLPAVCCFCWVVVSLSISARFSYQYYIQLPTHPPLPRYLVVPFIY